MGERNVVSSMCLSKNRRVAAHILLVAAGLLAPAAFSVAVPTPAFAQGAPRRLPPPTRPFGGRTPQLPFGRQPVPTSEPAKPPGFLGGRFGVSGALAISGNRPGNHDGPLEDRRRALLRLASLGTAESLDALKATWETDGPLARDGVTRLAVARALRGLAREKGMRELLAGLVMLANDADNDATATAAAAAAFALAETHDPDATDFLLALAQENEAAAELSRNALAAHPPRTLPAALGPRSAATPTPALIQLAVALDDVRAIPFLRGAVRTAEPPVRLAALRALGHFGDGEAVPIARGWVKEAEPAPRLAALEVLIQGAPREAVAPLSRALGESAMRAEALKMAADLAEEGLLPALLPLATDKEPGVRTAALHALGKLLDQRAAEALGQGLADPETSLSAAAALATSRSRHAGAVLSASLASQPRRVAAVYAAVARHQALSEKANGLDEALEALRNGSGDDQHTIAFATAALGRSLTTSGHTAPSFSRGLLAAWASGAPLADEDRTALTALLAAEKVDETALAWLVQPAVAETVPSLRLLEWVERGGAGAPIAALVLSSRDGPDQRDRIARWLRSNDAQLRAHVAWGLGQSPRADAAALLASAYEREADPVVRRALVNALGSSLRREAPIARRTLELAARLDAASSVRAMASASLRSPSVLPTGAGFRGRYTSFVRIPTGAALARTTLRFETPTGLVLPVRADGGGALVVAGLPPGVSHVSLAATTLALPEGSP
jgi:HEAT repeat protein